MRAENVSRPKIKYLRRGLNNTDRMYDKECMNIGSRLY
jgi:hypothetical protein